jgi:hypothetical protein
VTPTGKRCPEYDTKRRRGEVEEATRLGCWIATDGREEEEWR